MRLLKLSVMITLFAGAVMAQCGSGGVVIPNPFGPVPSRICTGSPGLANISASSVGAVTSLTLNTSTLNAADTTAMLVQCWTGTTTFSPVAISSLNPVTISGGIVTVVTPNFASTGNVYCTANKSGGAGPVGAKGDTGATGAKGDTGATGAKGDPGATGPAGATGATGPQGIPGTGNNTTCLDASGSTTAYTCSTPTPAISTLAGLQLSLVPQTTNGACPCTVNVASLGAKTLKQADGSTDIATASLVGGTGYSFFYNGTVFVQTSGVSAVGPNNTVQISDGNGHLKAGTPGTGYADATVGNGVPLASNGSGNTRAATQAELQGVLAPDATCSVNGRSMLTGGTCAAAGGQAATDIPITQSAATATFTCNSNTVNTFKITLTQNVTSSSLASCSAGQILNFVIGVGTGPFTFVPPTGFTLATDLSISGNLTVNANYTQSFEWTGSVARPLTGMTADAGPNGVVKETAMPAGNPGSGYGFSTFDSTLHMPQYKDSSGNIDTYLRIENCGANNWVNGIASTGRIGCAQPGSTQLSDTANLLYTNQNRSMGSATLTFPGGDVFFGGVNAQVGTSYTVGAADEDKLTTFNNGAAVAVTLPQATTAGFTSGAFFYMSNRGAGTVTITPTTSTINGSATLTLSQNQGCLIVSDGTNYSAWVSASPAGGNATTVNGGSIPASAPFVGTNSSNQIILATPFATNAQTATYQVLSGDFTGYKTIIVASGTFTITLVDTATQPATGQSIRVINYGSGVVTVARSGQNINGGTTALTLPAASAQNPTAVWVVSDGTNYFAYTTGTTSVSNLQGSGTGVNTALASNVSGSGGLCLTTSCIMTTPNLGTPSALVATNITGIPAAQVPADATVFGSGTITVPAGNHVLVGCTSTCTVPVPVPAAGYEICIKNTAGVTTVITLSALGSSAMYPKADDSGYGTAGTGTMVGSAAQNKVCLFGRDSTHYELGAVNAAANWTVN